MLLHMTFTLVFLLCKVQSDDLSESKWRDMKNNVIQISEYCENRTCVAKCCPNGQMIARTATKGIKCVEPKNELVKKSINYSNINVYRWSYSSKEFIYTKKNLKSDCEFVQNEIFWAMNRVAFFTMCKIFILKDGSLEATCLPSTKRSATRLEYCVDFFRNGNKNTSTGMVPNVVFAYRVLKQDDSDGKIKHDFAIAGMLVSSFFMALVLLVYGLLPKLRNFHGLIVMAYIMTYILACLLNVAKLIALNTHSIDSEDCRHLSPAVYYFTLATFFWLNIMSFDICYLTLSNLSGHIDMKFRYYCIFAWATPAVVTLITVAVDELELYQDDNYKPPFDSCFAIYERTAIYLHIPIGIIITANWVLFLLTIFKIWWIRGKVANSKESRNTGKNEARFITCIKVSVLMGVSWITELIPSFKSLAPHILINLYNMFVGIAIFIIFVCKKRVVAGLCKRFNIQNSFVDRLQPSLYTRSETNRNSSHRKSHTTKTTSFIATVE